VSRRQREAKERARQLVAAQRRAEERRRRLAIAGAGVAAVVLVLVVLVVVKLSSSPKPADGYEASSGPAPAAVLAAVSAVPADILDRVGTGKVSTLPKGVTGQAVLTSNGKPLVVYIGAEYCPFCAAQRWSVAVALSRFGTFTDLGVSHSAGDDVYPNTPTLSFHGANYTSTYLEFQGVETNSNRREGNGYALLDTPTSQQKQLLATFDAPPYVAKDSAGSIPFLDFANQAVISGASYSPELFAGKSVEQVAQALADPASPIAQAVDGAANAFTALLCQLTRGEPGAVCTSAAVTAYAGKFSAPS